MKDSLYHSLLRIAALTLALVLVFESGLVHPVTKELSQSTHVYLASSIGASASVAPTEVNTITARLTQMERDLEEREAALSEREIAVNLNTNEEVAAGDSDVAIYILSVILFILLVLIVLNYFLDYLRRNPAPQPVRS